jgi:integrase
MNDINAENRAVLEPGRLAIYKQPAAATWYMDITLPGQKRQRKTTGTADRREAESVAWSAYRDIEHKIRKGIPLQGRTVKSVVSEYVDHRRREHQDGKISVHTVDQAKRVVTDLFLKFFEKADDGKSDRLITDIDDADMRRYLKWRLSRNADIAADHEYVRNGKTVKGKRSSLHAQAPKGSTLNKEANALRTLFAFAVERGYLGRNAVPHIETHDPDYESGGWFQVHELVRLIKAARERMDEEVSGKGRANLIRDRKLLWLWVGFMAVTGMRPIGCRNLKWGDIRLFRLQDKSMSFELHIREKGAERNFYINDGSDSFWLQEIAKGVLGEKLDDVIGNPNFADKQLFEGRNFKKSFKSLVKAAGFDPDEHSPYSLRHSFINWRLLRGDSISDVAILVGNSPSVIERHYLKLTPLIIAERDARKRRDSK